MNQQQRILELLKSKSIVALPEILSLGIGQYNARIKELREQGYRITNKTQLVNGQKHSWYKLETL